MRFAESYLTKKPGAPAGCAWNHLKRRRWDLNPRAPEGNSISSRARYDHFDTSPIHEIYFTRTGRECQPEKTERKAKPGAKRQDRRAVRPRLQRTAPVKAAPVKGRACERPRLRRTTPVKSRACERLHPRRAAPVKAAPAKAAGQPDGEASPCPARGGCHRPK